MANGCFSPLHQSGTPLAKWLPQYRRFRNMTAQKTAEARQERIRVIRETGIASIPAGSDRQTVLNTLLKKTLGLIETELQERFVYLMPTETCWKLLPCKGNSSTTSSTMSWTKVLFGEWQGR